MQIAPIPQKALSPLLSHCGSSNRYPVRPAEKKHGREGEIRFPVESAITAEGITAQMFRIIKTGACFSTRRVSGCPCASSMLLGKIKTKTLSQRVRSAGCVVARCEKSGGHPQKR